MLHPATSAYLRFFNQPTVSVDGPRSAVGGRRSAVGIIMSDTIENIEEFTKGASNDKFYIVIEATDPKYDAVRTADFLKTLSPTFVKEIAMQVAAASPTYATRDAVPADILEKEKSIYRAQMENSGKPANVLEKIITGKLGSYYSQVVLPDQESIRDPKATVKDVIAAAGKTFGAPVAVTRFVRLKVGETTA